MILCIQRVLLVFILLLVILAKLGEDRGHHAVGVLQLLLVVALVQLRRVVSIRRPLG